MKREERPIPQGQSQARRDLTVNSRAVRNQGRQISAIEIISFLAFVYAGLGYLNQTYLHLVDSFWLSNYSDRIAILAFGNFVMARQKLSDALEQLQIAGASPFNERIAFLRSRLLQGGQEDRFFVSRLLGHRQFLMCVQEQCGIAGQITSEIFRDC